MLPDELTGNIRAMIEQGMAVMKKPSRHADGG